MLETFTREALEKLSCQHLNTLHDLHSDEFRELKRQLSTLEHNILLIKSVRNQRKGIRNGN